jgi:hypothetical protein
MKGGGGEGGRWKLCFYVRAYSKFGVTWCCITSLHSYTLELKDTTLRVCYVVVIYRSALSPMNRFILSPPSPPSLPRPLYQ